jgi:hypothetical protein
MGKTLDRYPGIPEPVLADPEDPNINELIVEELAHVLPSNEELMTMEKALNTEQEAAYLEIVHAYNTNTPAVFFIDGPAGTLLFYVSLLKRT